MATCTDCKKKVRRHGKNTCQSWYLNPPFCHACASKRGYAIRIGTGYIYKIPKSEGNGT